MTAQVFTTDVAGRVIVIQDGKITKEWGVSDLGNGIISASFDYSSDLMLALSRLDGSVEIMNPVTGTTYYSVTDENENPEIKTDLFLFKKPSLESPSRLFYCSSKMGSIVSIDFSDDSLTSRWRLDGGVERICSSAVNNNQDHCIFAGKTNGNLCLVKIEDRKKVWNWKSKRFRDKSFKSDYKIPYRNVCSLTFSSIDSHKIFAGTNNSQVLLFDPLSNEDEPKSVAIPVSTSSPINVLVSERDSPLIYFGTGTGCLGVIDQRTAQPGEYIADEASRCGSIRSIARHPHSHLLASAGSDGYLRVWDIRSRNLLSKVNVEHKLSSVFFGPDIVDEVNKAAPPAVPEDEVSQTSGKMKMEPQGQGSHKSRKSKKAKA